MTHIAGDSVVSGIWGIIIQITNFSKSAPQVVSCYRERKHYDLFQVLFASVFAENYLLLSYCLFLNLEVLTLYPILNSPVQPADMGTLRDQGEGET